LTRPRLKSACSWEASALTDDDVIVISDDQKTDGGGFAEMEKQLDASCDPLQ
jgi:hypothetical protein